MKLSQWHDGSVKPVHIGVYETLSEIHDNEQCYQYWDGKYWCWCSIHIEWCQRNISRHQKSKWRGIVKDKK